MLIEILRPEEYQPLAISLFNDISKKIQNILPDAQIEHIGSSSIEGLLSKGDLDIYVATTKSTFAAAILALEDLGFRIKQGSLRTESLCPFESHNYPLDVGVQLVEKGSKFEFFLKFRDTLRKEEILRTKYNELKLDSRHLDPDAYRKAKSKFIEEILQNY